MERIVERPAGLDVPKDVVVADVHLPVGVVEQGSFGTTMPGWLVLRDWLVGHGVTSVGIESTGVYWSCVYYMLEDDMEVWLLNARHMRNIPGRKTDVCDASWICRLNRVRAGPPLVRATEAGPGAEKPHPLSQGADAGGSVAGPPHGSPLASWP